MPCFPSPALWGGRWHLSHSNRDTPVLHLGLLVITASGGKCRASEGMLDGNTGSDMVPKLPAEELSLLGQGDSPP